jgi:hypothetical protein
LPVLFFYLPVIIFQVVFNRPKGERGASEPFNLDPSK